MIRRLMLGSALLAAFSVLWSCDSKEKNQLRAQNDSLRTELQASKEVAQTLEEVGTLLDSIDANRQLLRTDMVEGTSYGNYSNRLKDINRHIRETQAKISELEQSLKSTKSSYTGTISKLRRDLESRSQQLAALEEEVERMRGENQNLTRTVSERDSVLNVNSETIKMREQDIASLEQKVEEINQQAQTNQADLYFAQAVALETAAERTKFAPKKKKETQREALELYKLSLSMGKEEAQQKIDELEKELS